jgi:1-acyl-sn-glycerol-3-phosphate acyltransferase
MKADAEIDRYSRAFYAFQFPVARFFGWLLMFVLGRIKTIGKSRVPREGGLLILMNHRSDCDPVAGQVACPRPVRFMAKSELWDMKGVRTVLNWMKAFPVKRGEPDKSAIKHAVELLKAGECVGVFPEGQLTETGELQELKPGIALIVRMSGVPVICCGLRNTEGVVPYKSLVPRISRKRVICTWGDTKSFERKAETEEIMGWVEGELKRLTVPSLEGGN